MVLYQQYFDFMQLGSNKKDGIINPKGRQKQTSATPVWVSPAEIELLRPEETSGSEEWCVPRKWSTEVKRLHSEIDRFKVKVGFYQSFLPRHTRISWKPLATLHPPTETRQINQHWRSLPRSSRWPPASSSAWFHQLEVEGEKGALVKPAEAALPASCLSPCVYPGRSDLISFTLSIQLV